jgi:hypothetical protein
LSAGALKMGEIGGLDEVVLRVVLRKGLIFGVAQDGKFEVGSGLDWIHRSYLTYGCAAGFGALIFVDWMDGQAHGQ